MELTLFIIVGAIAVISAAMMLISENAIYSALFLILNFACIAFFFLMLNAPFLAMVQITVYAGAIMVLFLFVIMLLGAERLLPEEHSPFRWLAPAVIGLALVFLVVASMAIIGGEIDLTVEPQKTGPYLRVVHALDGVEAVDVYVDDEQVANDLDFRESSEFETWATGRYDVALYTAGADPAADEPLAEETVTLDPGEAVSLVALAPSGTTGATLATASEDIAYIDESDAVRLIVVNGLPDRSAVDVWDETSDTTIVHDLPYGAASDPVEINAGTRTIGLHPAGDAQTRLAALDQADLEANTSRLLVFTEARQPDNSFVDVVINLETESRPTFGSPTHVGQLLYTRYVLPFWMVALLLLVAMIGAIVLTHESLSTRRQLVRRLANPPAGLDQPIIGESSK